MFESSAFASMLTFLAVFFAVSGLLVLLARRLDSDSRRALARLRDLSPPNERPPDGPTVRELALSAPAKVGKLLLPAAGGQRGRLRDRLVQAGFYNPQAQAIFLGAQLLLAAALPLVVVLVPYLCGLLPARWAANAAVIAAGVGVLLPGLWVDSRCKQRQNNYRNALPDALDMLVLCLEGGLSLPAALQRVTDELQVAHPLLASQMAIVQREMQLGLSAGEALKKFGQRCGLEEVLNLSSVLLQSERFGASVVKALRVYADSCRVERQQRAEEMAQKAAVKILFPTLLCIFPAIFIVILGPAAHQITAMFAQMK
jgi:tight adherence protein C